MKNKINKLVILFVLAIGMTLQASSQIIVKVRPAAPVVVRTVAPGPRHVWIDGGWVVRNGRYTYVDGYWATPRAGLRYAPGHWASRKGGWVWISGKWTRGRR